MALGERKAMRPAMLATGFVVLAVGLALGGFGSLPRVQLVTEAQPVQISRSTEWQVAWRTFTPEGRWGAVVGTGEFPSTFSFDWTNGNLFGQYSDWIGFDATATVKAPRSGPVTFTIGSDDGSRLFVDGRVVIDLWSDHVYTTRSAIVDLTEGAHSLVVSYYEKTERAQVSFAAPADVLAWQETEYRIATRQVTLTDATLQGLGVWIAFVGIALVAIGAASKPKHTASWARGR